MNKRRFGIIGEKIAQDYLRRNGYEILKTNFYTRKGEIDIIASINNIIVFVEVKTRTNLKYGTPAMAVRDTKLKHIKSTAKIFLKLNNLYKYEIRFDVIEILIKDGKCFINHIKKIIWVYEIFIKNITNIKMCDIIEVLI